LPLGLHNDSSYRRSCCGCGIDVRRCELPTGDECALLTRIIRSLPWSLLGHESRSTCGCAAMSWCGHLSVSVVKGSGNGWRLTERATGGATAPQFRRSGAANDPAAVRRLPDPSGVLVGRCSLICRFRSTTRTASLTNRRRRVSNCMTRNDERRGISAFHMWASGSSMKWKAWCASTRCRRRCARFPDQAEPVSGIAGVHVWAGPSHRCASLVPTDPAARTRALPGR
jgi:hypothetical protein